MIRVIYYYSQLNVGGAEKSTVRLLNKMAERGWDVTVLLKWNGGALESELSDRVKRIYLRQMREGWADKKWRRMLWSLIQYTLYPLRELRLHKQAYDVCISGLFGYPPGLLFRHVRAGQYYQLLRNDVLCTGHYGRTEAYMKRYGARFDAYIGVSDYTTKTFQIAYPALGNRALTIYNVLPQMQADPQAVSPYGDFGAALKIVTVCRLNDQAKGLYRMAEVCRRLKEKHGDRFVWFVVGDGSDRAELEKRIDSYGLQRTMILCGEQQNVAPYYQFADLVAVLSYYEGLCGVVNEAKVMGRPVIATEFSGIHEQLRDGENGFIVENTEEAIFEKMDAILSDPSVLEPFNNCGLPTALCDNDYKISRYETLYRCLSGGVAAEDGLQQALIKAETALEGEGASEELGRRYDEE